MEQKNQRCCREQGCVNLASGGYKSANFLWVVAKKGKSQCDFDSSCSFHARI